MRFRLYPSHSLTDIGLKMSLKSHKLGLCGHLRDLRMTLKLKLQTSNFSQTKIPCKSLKVISYTVETCQTPHFQVTLPNIVGFYGPYTQVTCLLKALTLAHVNRILIYIPR